MRTTALDCIKLAWFLWRSRHRKHLRIGQLLINSSAKTASDLFYLENRGMRELLRYYNRAKP